MSRKTREAEVEAMRERSERIAAAVRTEIRHCVSAAQETVDRIRAKAEAATDFKLIKVPR